MFVEFGDDTLEVRPKLAIGVPTRSYYILNHIWRFFWNHRTLVLLHYNLRSFIYFVVKGNLSCDNLPKIEPKPTSILVRSYKYPHKVPPLNSNWKRRLQADSRLS